MKNSSLIFAWLSYILTVFLGWIYVINILACRLFLSANKSDRFSRFTDTRWAYSRILQLVLLGNRHTYNWVFNRDIRNMFIQLIKEFIPSLEAQECLDCWNVICGSFKALEHSDLKLSFILFEHVLYQPQITKP